MEDEIKHEVTIVKHRSDDFNFKSKSDAFDHFFSAYLNAGLDDLKAAEKAQKIADTIGAAKGLPDKRPEMMQQASDALNKLVEMGSQHPKMVEFVTGILTGIVGTKAATSSDEKKFDESKKDEIDFDEIE